MNLAQGAIETARAAGAERYAPEEYKAAIASLDRSREMVDQRDYRQALNFALDARERAHEAARTGAERMAQIRSEAETLLQAATLALQRAQARAKGASGARGSERLQATLRDAITEANRDLQEARAAIARQEYQQALERARAADARLRKALVQESQPSTPRDRRPPARRPVS
jgi:hypothetical protein